MRKKEEVLNRNAKSKMTMMMFQLEGEDATLQEGFRTIAQAMNTILKPVYSLPALPSKNSTSDHGAVPALAPSDGATPAETDQTQEPGEPVNGRATRAQRSYKSPEIINDLDLVSGPPTLKDFLTEKGVSDNDAKRCLAIAVWLKNNRRINDVTGSLCCRLNNC